MVDYFPFSSMAETYLDSNNQTLLFPINKYDQIFYGSGYEDFQTATNTGHANNIKNLKSLNNKILMIANSGMFHVNMDVLGQVVSILLTTNYDVVIDLKRLEADTKKDNHKNIYQYFNLVIDYLNKIFNNRIILFNSDHYEFYIIDNFFIMNDNYKPSMQHIIKTSEYIKQSFNISTLSDETKYKKVYLSRKYILKRGPYGQGMPSNNPDFTKIIMDDRMIDEDVLESFFKNNGFEIVYPEEFASIEEQVQYFSQVNLLISTTSSGLGNMFFMPKKSTIIELVTSFIVRSEQGFNHATPQPKVFEILHNQYGPLAYILDLLYLRIPNYTRESKDIIDYILSNKSIYNLLWLGVKDD